MIDMLCFIHIEKCAGMTFHNILINNYFLNYLSLIPWNPWTNIDESSFGKNDLKWLLRGIPNLRGFGGHNTRIYNGYGEVCNDIQYVTFLRNPITRYISHYIYQVEIMNNKLSFEDFLSEKRFDNFMTKRIAGCFDGNKAKKILNKNNVFVGLSENFDESLLLMKNKFNFKNLNISYEKKNVSKDDSLKNKILNDKDNLDKIKQRNLLDIELYDFAKNELFNNEIANYERSLSSNLEIFKNQNQKYRFSAFKRSIYDSVRYLYYRNIEFIIYKFSKKN